MSGAIQFKPAGDTLGNSRDVSPENPLPVTNSGASGSGPATTTDPAPVLVEGQYNTTRPTLTNGQYGPLQATQRGALIAAIGDSGNSIAVLLAGNMATYAPSQIGLLTIAENCVYDAVGDVWRRQLGDSTGTYSVPGLLPAATDRSGTATTSSGTLAAANASRRGLNVQNIGANNIGVNEFGGTAVIGTAGTYTLAPGASMVIRTNRLVTVIAATGATAYSATEF